MRRLALVLAALAACSPDPAPAAKPLPTDTPPPKDTMTAGLPLHPEQEAYDVQHYELVLTVDPAARTIRGSLTATVRATAPLARVILDLHDALKVTGASAPFHQGGGQVWIDLGRWLAAGETATVRIDYGGTPRVAPNPPWDGGFTWKETPSGAPWVATSCQVNGADLWWPCKDYPNDKPETMDLKITVPAGLYVASNGTLKSRDGDTFHWHIANPISVYNVALNIAPFEVIEDEFKSIGGETVPVRFYVLPESVEKARAALPGFLDHLRVAESLCGPYPWRNEKYGIVETPFLGMEHQTIIAYGNLFRADARGYDSLHHHEMSHEWWGNLVTNRNWNDMWIHEGIGTYMQALYIERKFGADAYRAEMASKRHFNLRIATAPREPLDTKSIYTKGDIYNKGSWVMHTLRWLIGEEAFLRALRRMAYPDPAKERVTDGSQCRFSDTEEIRSIAERESGMKLDWFFEVYVRRAALPELVRSTDGALEWKAPDGLPFPMPVPVRVGGEVRRVEMPGGRAPEGAEVDPDDWVLRK